MPVPKPKPEETQDSFISRCMGDDTMKEYDQEQRAAICYKTFKESKGEKIKGKVKKTTRILKALIEKEKLKELKSHFVNELSDYDFEDFSETGKDIFKNIYAKARIENTSIELSKKIAYKIAFREDSGNRIKLLQKLEKEIKRILAKKIKRKSSRKQDSHFQTTEYYKDPHG